MPGIFADMFAGTAAATIQSRSANIGTWLLMTGSTNAVLTAAGRARSGAASNFPTYFTTAAPPSADYDVQCDLFFATVAGTVGIYARVDSTVANDYSVYWDTPTAKWVLGKDASSSGVVLASTATPVPTSGSTHTIFLRVVGAQISGWVDDVLIGSVPDSPGISAINKPGIFLNGGATPSDSVDVHIDNYVVSTPGSPPFPPPAINNALLRM